MLAVVAAGGGGFLTASVLVKPRASVDWMSAVVSWGRVRPSIRTSLNGSSGVRLLKGGGKPELSLCALRKSEGSDQRPQSATVVTPPLSEKNAAGTGLGGVTVGFLPSNRRTGACPGARAPLTKRIRSNAGLYVTPFIVTLPLTRPQACVISCRRTATRSSPGAKPVPMPMKPSGPLL